MLDDGNWSKVFSSEQRVRLENLGLYVEQINRLQAALDVVNFETREKPTLNDLHAIFNNIDRYFSLTIRAIEKLNTKKDSAADEVRFRTRVTTLPDGSSIAAKLGQLVNELNDGRSLIAQVRTGLPKGQTRQTHAKSFPVERIAHELWEGFLDRHDPSRSGNKLPKYYFSVSRSRKFQDVIRVCYEAVGLKDIDPDHTIRAYLEHRANSSKTESKNDLNAIENRGE